MLCTVVADVADGRIVFQDGTQDACAARYTPASTFKLAIALMGYDAGILQDAHAPVWDYQPSYRTGAATTGASLSIRRTGSSTPFSGIRSR